VQFPLVWAEVQRWICPCGKATSRSLVRLRGAEVLLLTSGHNTQYKTGHLSADEVLLLTSGHNTQYKTGHLSAAAALVASSPYVHILIALHWIHYLCLHFLWCVHIIGVIDLISKYSLQLTLFHSFFRIRDHVSHSVLHRTVTWMTVSQHFFT
jgi:hypothetical protein